MCRRQARGGQEAQCWQRGSAPLGRGSPAPVSPPPAAQVRACEELRSVVVSFRHPWSFLTVKGNPAASVEDHTEYHGKDGLRGARSPPPSVSDQEALPELLFPQHG